MNLTIDASVFVAALQPSERDHAEAVRFLVAVESAGHEIHCPATLLPEVASAVARASKNTTKGLRAMEGIKEMETLRLVPLSGDSLYTGVAEVLAATLVTYDKEMRERSRAVVKVQTPREWLTNET